MKIIILILVLLILVPVYAEEVTTDVVKGSETDTKSSYGNCPFASKMIDNNMRDYKAHKGMMYKGGGNMMGYGASGLWLLKLVYFALAVFVFSVIFWLTHNWLVKKRK